MTSMNDKALMPKADTAPAQNARVSPPNYAAKPAVTSPMSANGSAEPNKHTVLKDISTKWDKFSPQELSAIKTQDDLVKQVESKYGLEKGLAQREVDAVLRGRAI